MRDSSGSESVKEKIGRLAIGLLEEHSLRSTLELLKRVEATGVEVAGKNKAVYLANILSTDARFVSRRKFGGWFLVESDPLKSDTPVVPATGVSFDNPSLPRDDNLEESI